MAQRTRYATRAPRQTSASRVLRGRVRSTGSRTVLPASRKLSHTICYRRSVAMCMDRQFGSNTRIVNRNERRERAISLAIPVPLIAASADEPPVPNHALKGGTLNRPYLFVSYRKQKSEHAQGRNVPSHAFAVIFRARFLRPAPGIESLRLSGPHGEHRVFHRVLSHRHHQRALHQQ